MFNFVEEQTVIVITAVINLSVAIWIALVEKFSVSLEIVLSLVVHPSCKWLTGTRDKSHAKLSASMFLFWKVKKEFRPSLKVILLYIILQLSETWLVFSKIRRTKVIMLTGPYWGTVQPGSCAGRQFVRVTEMSME